MRTVPSGRSEGGLPWHLPDESAQFPRPLRRPVAARRTPHVRGNDRLVSTRASSPRPDPPAAHLAPGAASPAPSTPPPRRAPSGRCTRPRPTSCSAGQLIVLGGAETYRAALPFADRLILSRIHQRTGAAIHFPPSTSTRMAPPSLRVPTHRPLHRHFLLHPPLGTPLAPPLEGPATTPFRARSPGAKNSLRFPKSPCSRGPCI